MKMSPSKKGLLPIVASFLTGVLVFDFGQKPTHREIPKFWKPKCTFLSTRREIDGGYRF